MMKYTFLSAGVDSSVTPINDVSANDVTRSENERGSRDVLLYIYIYIPIFIYTFNKID